MARRNNGRTGGNTNKNPNRNRGNVKKGGQKLSFKANKNKRGAKGNVTKITRQIIEKNLQPLKENLKKKKLAQALYYNQTDFNKGLSPLKKNAFNSNAFNPNSIHNRLGNPGPSSSANKPGSSRNLNTNLNVRSPNVRNQNARNPNARNLNLNTRNLNANIRNPNVNVRNQNANIRNQNANIRNQNANIRNLNAINRNVNNPTNRNSNRNIPSNNFVRKPQGIVTKRNQNQRKFSNQMKIQRNRQGNVKNINTQRSPLKLRRPNLQHPADAMLIASSPEKIAVAAQTNVYTLAPKPANYTVQVSNVKREGDDSQKHHISADLNPRLQAEIRQIQARNMVHEIVPPIPIHPVGAGVTKRTLNERFSEYL